MHNLTASMRSVWLLPRYRVIQIRGLCQLDLLGVASCHRHHILVYVEF